MWRSIPPHLSITFRIVCIKCYAADEARLWPDAGFCATDEARLWPDAGFCATDEASLWPDAGFHITDKSHL